jgi:carboxypeptidase Taq
MTEKLMRFRELLGEISDIGSASSVLGWDQQTYMPPGGAPARAQQMATLDKLSHEMFVSDEFRAALEGAKQETADLDPDSDEARLVKRVARDFDKATKVPSEWVQEFSIETNNSFMSWQASRAEASFAGFAEPLKKIVALRRQYVDFFAPYDHVYDPLLDDYEPGMKTAEVKAVFDELRPQQVELLREIVERGAPVDDSPLRQKFPEKKQLAFGLEVIKSLGYDMERGRQDLAPHPFSTGFSRDDVRITTRVEPEFLSEAIFSSMHEAGHAMYNQGVGDFFERTPLSGGTSSAVDESQSRLWENLVGRSRPFWKAFYPRLQKKFSKQFGSVDLEDFYRAINKVEPSFIRTDADEATYNLHVMLRFDIEIALMQGDLEVADLPSAWNDKFNEYLGLTPPDDAKGVLQDIHWSYGDFGYFPTYSLGNLVASQLWENIATDIPDLEAQIEKADFGDLLAWLREKIHVYGGKYMPTELIKLATGRDLTPEPYLKYLRNKYGEIYKL